MGDFLSGVLGTNSSVATGQSQKLGLQDYLPAINQGQSNYNQLYGQQQQLAQALQQQMNGQGPNPATSLLTQAQGQNAAQAAGVYANNRAINPALAARQAMMAQSQGNQVAGNNAATLTAQQQIAATQNLAGLYGQMGSLNNQNLGINQSSMAAQNNAINGANSINAGIAQGNQEMAGKEMGGFLGSAGIKMQAHGGMVTPMADGGMVNIQDYGGSAMGAQSLVGKYLSSVPQVQMRAPAPDSSSPASGGGGGIAGSPLGKLATSIFGGGAAAGAGADAAPAAAALFSGGSIQGKVPGKASVPGDSLKNDKVPTMLSPGEIVIPRHITQGADAPNKAKAFVAAVLAREGMKKK